MSQAVCHSASHSACQSANESVSQQHHYVGENRVKQLRLQLIVVKGQSYLEMLDDSMEIVGQQMRFLR